VADQSAARLEPADDDPVVVEFVDGDGRRVPMTVRQVVEAARGEPLAEGVELPKGFDADVIDIVDRMEADREASELRAQAKAESGAEYEDDGMLAFRMAHETAYQILCERDWQQAQDAHAQAPGDPGLILALQEAEQAAAQAKERTARSAERWQAKRLARERLGRTLEAFRHESGLSREQLAVRCGLSTSTIKTLETNADPDKAPTPKTKAAIEKALGWEPGSFDAVLDGGEPTMSRRLPSRAGTDEDEGDGPEAPESRRRYTRLRLEPDVLEQLERIAYLEERNVNDIVEEAIDLYWRLKGPRPEAR
jgi:transcriptional regulator with XRE-family HTH domain